MSLMSPAERAVVKIAGSSIEPRKNKPSRSKRLPVGEGLDREPIDQRLVVSNTPVSLGSAGVEARRMPLRYRFQFAPSKVPAINTQLPISPEGIGTRAAS